MLWSWQVYRGWLSKQYGRDPFFDVYAWACYLTAESWGLSVQQPGLRAAYGARSVPKLAARLDGADPAEDALACVGALFVAKLVFEYLLLGRSPAYAHDNLRVASCAKDFNRWLEQWLERELFVPPVVPPISPSDESTFKEWFINVFMLYSRVFLGSASPGGVGVATAPCDSRACRNHERDFILNVPSGAVVRGYCESCHTYRRFHRCGSRNVLLPRDPESTGQGPRWSCPVCGETVRPPGQMVRAICASRRCRRQTRWFCIEEGGRSAAETRCEDCNEPAYFHVCGTRGWVQHPAGQAVCPDCRTPVDPGDLS